MSKFFAIGDIHGCFDHLTELMASLEIDDQNDTLIFIGDYIDRGPSSRRVVDYLLDLSGKFKKVVYLRGNHEQMLLRYLEGLDTEMYLYNGGTSTLLSYGLTRQSSAREALEKIPSEHLCFFESLLPFYETEDYIFVHAGLKPGIKLAEQEIHDLLWIRQDFIDSDFNFGKRVIFGHTPRFRPLIAPNKIGIDTGAVLGGRLTCLELPTLRIYQA